jgi:hypothetical protein
MPELQMAIQQVAEVPSAAIAITVVTVIDVISGAHRTNLTVLIRNGQGTGADSVDLLVAKGIVGTRDMGGDADFILALRERIKSGGLLGPEIFASGPILDNAPPDFPYRRACNQRSRG